MGVGALTRRAVFLDRDGVLNDAVIRDGKPYPPDSVEELRVVDGAADALALLRDRGFLLVVVTNQPDVARGRQQKSIVETMHRSLREALPVDAFFTCYHTDGDICACRKPLPGLLHEAAREWSVDLDESFMVGDRWRDIEAGQAAGCRTVWIDHGYRERGPSRPPDARVRSIGEAAAWIVEQAV
jgi:D-glycero-D-manno-heptose 1,7-bisphosphate phosphatase